MWGLILFSVLVVSLLFVVSLPGVLFPHKISENKTMSSHSPCQDTLADLDPRAQTANFIDEELRSWTKMKMV